MADVARVAGVHVSTVSLALRNHPSLPPETRERIQEIAGRMGYRPDPALSALMAMRKKTRSRGGPAPIAYITNWGSEFGWKEHPAHAQFHSGASARALKLGYRLEHFWLGEPGMSERRLNSILRARGIAGIISASHQQDSSMAGTFEWKDFSAVKIDYFPSEPALHLVTNDQRCISQMAMHHVIDAGYRRIGLVMPKWWDEYADRTWSAGFLARQRSLPTGDQVPIFEYDLPVSPPGGGTGPLAGAIPARGHHQLQPLCPAPACGTRSVRPARHRLCRHLPDSKQRADRGRAPKLRPRGRTRCGNPCGPVAPEHQGHSRVPHGHLRGRHLERRCVAARKTLSRQGAWLQLRAEGGPLLQR
jgi:DNA-binding LacI/PurR family transcriptional regulator